MPVRLAINGGNFVDVKNRYSDKVLTCNYEGSHEKVLILEDVISSGRTVKELVELCRRSELDPVLVLAICSRNPNLQRLEEDIAVPIRTLAEDL